MGKELVDTIVEAGNIVLESEPFTDWLGFYARLDDVTGGPHGANDNEIRAQEEILEVWGESIKPRFQALGVDFEWTKQIDSYVFDGMTHAIGGDFPKPVRFDTLPRRALFKSTGVDLSLTSGDYQIDMSLRSQYGEPFLDSLCITRTMQDIPGEILEQIRSLPISIISAVEPLEEKDRRDIANMSRSTYIDSYEPPFYFEPDKFDFTGFVFRDGHVVVPKQQIVEAYLREFGEDLYPEFDEQDVPDIEEAFVNFVVPSETYATAEDLRQAIVAVYKREATQRNQALAGIVQNATQQFNPLEGEFYVMCGDEKPNWANVHSHHYTSDRVVGYNQEIVFPRTFVLKFEEPDAEGRRAYSLSYSRESKGDYCVWMREERGLRKVVDHVFDLVK